MPTPRVRTEAGDGATTSAPCHHMLPEVGLWMPATTFTTVDLPAPFSPRSAWNSPGSTRKSMSFRAVVAPKDLLRFRSSSSSAAMRLQ